MRLRRIAAAFISLAGLLIIGLTVHRIQALPDSPQPVGWDREACTECHMLISDRRYAAQLQTDAGDVLNFDDPGCLMTYAASRHPAAHAVYVRDSQSSGWLRVDEAGFVHTAQSPMGRGLAAVRKTIPGALTYTSALQEIQRASKSEEGR